MGKVIIVPMHTFETMDTKETRNTFCHLLEVILNNAPQKSNTETFLAHAIKGKLDELKQSVRLAAVSNGGTIPFALEDSEYEFVKGGLAYLRGLDRIQGDMWYYIVKPLAEAKDEQEQKKEIETHKV